MEIGGFNKHSLIDFPKNISCVVFTSGCNFSCPYCHNPDLAANIPSRTGNLIPETHILSFLEKRKKLLDGVVISGGEPTLQSGLDHFCRAAKQMGYRVKLDTNGSRPHVIERLLEKKLVDYIAMDIKTNLQSYALAAGNAFNPSKITRSIKRIIDKAPAYEFRTTCIKPLLDKTIIADIAGMSRGAAHFILQQCSKNAAMLNPEFFNSGNLFFSDHELMAFKAHIESHVERCTLR